MRCGDLERYLEAFLDGRLGRSRSAACCAATCLVRRLPARVERLRQFERDTQRRFRTPEQTSSVWEGLELDLVGSNGAVGGGRLLALHEACCLPGGEPAPERSGPRRAAGQLLVATRPPSRGTASRLAGVLLVAMALERPISWFGARSDRKPAEPPPRPTSPIGAIRRRRCSSSDDAQQPAGWRSSLAAPYRCRRFLRAIA